MNPSTILAKNLALHKPLIFSSVQQSNKPKPGQSFFGSIRVNNGVTSVAPRLSSESWSAASIGWSSKVKKNLCSIEQWVGVDLGQEYLSRIVVVFPRDDIGHEGEGFPIKVIIESSLNKIEWFSLALVGMGYLPLGIVFPRIIEFDAVPT